MVRLCGVPTGGRSDVRTLVIQEFAESSPNAARLLGQLILSADQQSEMIRGYSYEEREPEEVALTWIRNNPEKIQEFLDGVTTRDGQPAWPVVQKTLEIPDA